MKVAWQSTRAISAGVPVASEFRCDNGEPVRATFDLDCCDREAMSWVATTGAQTGDIVLDVMLAAVEHRFN